MGVLGRPRSMPDSDLKRRMFDAAAELLEQAGGFSLSLEHLNLETVMRRADVSRSAVYRLWPTKDAFNVDLLEELAAPNWMGAAALDEATPRLAAAIVMSDPQALLTASGRRTALLEAVRQAAWQNFDAIITKPAWRFFVVLALTLPSLPEGEHRNRLAHRLRESDRHFTERMAHFYRDMLPQLGLRPKPPFTDSNVYDILAKVGGALVEGLALHHGMDPDLANQRFSGPGGDWSPPAIGFLAIADALLEPDPHFRASPADRDALGPSEMVRVPLADAVLRDVLGQWSRELRLEPAEVRGVDAGQQRGARRRSGAFQLSGLKEIGVHPRGTWRIEDSGHGRGQCLIVRVVALDAGPTDNPAQLEAAVGEEPLTWCQFMKDEQNDLLARVPLSSAHKASVVLHLRKLDSPPALSR